MKRLTMNLMLATAVAMVASTVASAQEMKAYIPIQFRVGSAVMAPGSYTLTTAETWLALQNSDTHKAVMFGKGVLDDPPKAWVQGRDGKLEFECSDGCFLKRIWTGQGAPAHVYGTSKPSGGRGARLAVIRLALPGAK